VAGYRLTLRSIVAAIPPPARPADGADPTVLVHLARALVEEFRGDVAESVVMAYVAKAAAAVTFFGDDPAERCDWVERIAHNELNLLSGRDTDRARA
jgi:hypothetical protein